MELDCYRILGLDSTAQISQIKEKYRKLAKIHHPDHGGDEELMKKVNEAYKILIDPKLREKLDASLNEKGLNMTMKRLLCSEDQGLADIFRNLFEKFRNENINHNINALNAFKDSLKVEILGTIPKKTFQLCKICSLEIDDIRMHNQDMLKSYKDYIGNEKVNFLRELERIDQKGLNYTKNPYYSVEYIAENVEVDFRKALQKKEYFKEFERFVELKDSIKNLEQSYKASENQILPLLFDKVQNQDCLAKNEINELHKILDNDLNQNNSIFFFNNRQFPEGKFVLGQNLKKFVKELNLPKIIVSHPQSSQAKSGETCLSCLKKSSFFSKLIKCQKCLGYFCKDCIVKGKPIEAGFDHLVEVCKKCKVDTIYFRYTIWLGHLKTNLGLINHRALEIFLNIIKYYYQFCTQGNMQENLLYISNKFLNDAGDPDSSIRILLFIDADLKEFVNLFKFLITKMMFSKLYSVLIKLFEKRINFINDLMLFNDNYVSIGKTENDYILYTLLNLFINIYHQNNSIEMGSMDCFIKQIHQETQRKNYQRLIYITKILFQLQTSKTDFFIYSKEKISKNFESKETIYYVIWLHQKFIVSSSDWTKLVLRYISCDQLLLVLCILHYCPTQITSENQKEDLYLIREAPEKRLDYLISQYSVSKLSSGICIIIMASLLHENYNFEDLGNKYLSKNLVAASVLCYTISDGMKAKNNYLERGMNVLNSNMPKKIEIALQYFGISKFSWSDIAKILFKKGLYEQTLDCLFQRLDHQLVVDLALDLINLKKKNIARSFMVQLFYVNRNLFLDYFIQFKITLDTETGFLAVIKSFLKENQSDWENSKMIGLHKELLSMVIQEVCPMSLEVFKSFLHVFTYVACDNNIIQIWQKQQIKCFTKKQREIEFLLSQLMNQREALFLLKTFENYSLECGVYGPLILKEKLEIYKSLPIEDWSFWYFVKALIAINRKDWKNAVKNLQHVLSYSFLDKSSSLLPALTQILENPHYFSKFHAFSLQDLLQIEDFFKAPIFFDYSAFPISMECSLSFIEKSERYIQGYEKNDLEKAFLYIQLFAACHNIKALENSIRYFLRVMRNEKSIASYYASRNTILSVIQIIQEWIRSKLPPLQISCHKFCMAAIFESLSLYIKGIIMNQNSIPNNIVSIKDDGFFEVSKYLTKLSLNSFQRLIKIFPISAPNNTSIFDALIFHQANSDLLKTLLENLSQTDSNNSLCPYYIAKYYLYEGILDNWIDARELINEYRENAIRCLLENKQNRHQQVEKLMKWTLISRNNEGWINEFTIPLNLDPKNQYINISGIEINKKNGQIKLLLGKSSRGLFDLSDISEILTKGIEYAIFTLEPPSNEIKYHPFQEMKYAPKALKGTNLLMNLLHTDYLLKILTTGVEPNANFPFNFRSSEFLLSRLPDEFIQELNEIKVKSRNKSSRFWIQADEFAYDIKIKDDTIMYIFEDCKMNIFSKSLRVDENGNLIDDECCLNSTDQEIAAFLTKTYELLGDFFPEFARLRELMKICFVSRIIKSNFENISKNIQNLRNYEEELTVTINDIESRLKELGQYEKNSYSDQYYALLNERKKSLKKVKNDIQGYESVLQTMVKHKFCISKLEEEKLSNDVSECSWIPAVLNIKENFLVYGGVSLVPNPKQSTLNEPKRNQYYNGQDVVYNPKSNRETTKDTGNSSRKDGNQTLSRQDMNKEIDRVFVMRRVLDILPKFPSFNPNKNIISHSGVLIKTKDGRIYQCDAIQDGKGRLAPRLVLVGTEDTRTVCGRYVTTLKINEKKLDGAKREYTYTCQQFGTQVLEKKTLGDIYKSLGKYTGNGKYDIITNTCHHFQERLRKDHGFVKNDNDLNYRDQLRQEESRETPTFFQKIKNFLTSFALGR